MTGLSLAEIADKMKISKTTPEASADFTTFVMNRVYSSFLNAGMERTPGVHVSSIIYDCMRSPCYGIKHGRRMDLMGIIRTGIGTHLHDDIKILPVQELPLEWEGIVTDGVDEYDPETGIFIDKKITWNPPSYGMWDKHKKQLEDYKVMLHDNGYKATEGFILYIVLSKPNSLMQLRHGNKIRALKTVRKEMRANRDIILRFNETGELPPRVCGQDCNFCADAAECLTGYLK